MSSNDNSKISSKAKIIADEARSSLSNYCITICGAKCCKFGKLLLQNDDEVKTICGKENISNYSNEKIIEKTQNNFVTYDLEKKPCQHLKESDLCSIHKSKSKPQICNDYPLFLTKKYIIASKQCPAVVEGELDKHIQKIKDLGFQEF